MPDTPTKPLAAAGEKPEGAKPMDAWRRPAGRGRWFERGERPWADAVVGALKTLGWLAPLTVLIWVYAEREQTSTKPNLPVPIGVRNDVGSRLVMLVQPADKNMILEIAGPQVGLDAVENELRAPAPDRPPVQITVDPNLGPGKHFIAVQNQVANNPVFVRRGVSVRNCTPAMIQVEIDDLVSRDLPVKVLPGLDLASEPVFDPPTIKVTAPAAIFKDAETTGRLALLADLAKRIDYKKPGADKIPNVEVLWPYRDEHIRFKERTVTASVEIKAREKTFTIQKVPVWPTGPAGFFNENKIVDCPSFVTNVTVAGPPDQIELLERGEYKNLKAVLEVSRDDTVNPEPRKRPKFDLPPGVNPVDAAAVEEISFRLVPQPK